MNKLTLFTAGSYSMVLRHHIEQGETEHAVMIATTGTVAQCIELLNHIERKLSECIKAQKILYEAHMYTPYNILEETVYKYKCEIQLLELAIEHRQKTAIEIATNNMR